MNVVPTALPGEYDYVNHSVPFMAMGITDGITSDLTTFVNRKIAHVNATFSYLPVGGNITGFKWTLGLHPLYLGVTPGISYGEIFATGTYGNLSTPLEVDYKFELADLIEIKNHDDWFITLFVEPVNATQHFGAGDIFELDMVFRDSLVDTTEKLYNLQAWLIFVSIVAWMVFIPATELYEPKFEK